MWADSSELDTEPPSVEAPNEPRESVLFPAAFDSARSSPARTPRASTATPLEDPPSAHGETAAFSEVGVAGLARSSSSPVRMPATSGLGYLFLHEREETVPVLEIGNPARRAMVELGPSASTRVQSVYGELSSAYGEAEIAFAGESVYSIDGENAHYLLRELVQETLQMEADSLWRLTKEHRFAGRAGLADDDEEDQFEDGSFTAKDVPILSHLCENFLSTLPIIRDLKDPSSFFFDGVLPLCHILHRADLSKTVDRGHPDLLDQLSHRVHVAVADLVASGIKLASSSRFEGSGIESSSPENPLLKIEFSPQNLSSPSTTRSTPTSPVARRFSSLFKSSTPPPLSPSLGPSVTRGDMFAAMVPVAREASESESEGDDSASLYSGTSEGALPVVLQTPPRPLSTSIVASRQLPPSFGSPMTRSPRTKPLVPISTHLIPQHAVPWPWSAPAVIRKAPPVADLKHGGFEVDIVAVRTMLFSHAYLLRVRRPGVLDEFVLRSEEQFQKFFVVLDKGWPHAHIRGVPTGGLKDDPSPSTTVSPKLSVDLPPASVDSVPQRSNSVASKSKVNAQGSLGKATLQRRSTLPPGRLTGTAGGLDFALPLTTPRASVQYDQHRRALRTWLRDTLAVRNVGHHQATADFLLLGSIVPRKLDARDALQRELIDQKRRADRMTVAAEAPLHAKAVYDVYAAFVAECVHGEGLAVLSETMREVDSVEKLPEKYLKALEWGRASLAEGLFEMLVRDENSGSLFNKLKLLNNVVPWFLLKQILKLGNADTMLSRAHALFVARAPFGGTSILQKIIAIVMDDETLQQEIELVRTRIGSSNACRKIELFVEADRERKDDIRRFAERTRRELVHCIVRGSEEPRLSPYELDRVILAEKDARAFKKGSPSSHAKAQAAASSTSLQLSYDLQRYLRLVSRRRDVTVLRELFTEKLSVDALGVLVDMLTTLLKQVYRVGSASTALGDLKRFLDEAVVIVEALRARNQDPEQATRVLSRLLERHQGSLYSFVHKIHRGETVLEELLQWFSTVAVFSRRGLATTLDLDAVVPTDKTDFMAELTTLVEYHRRKRLHEYQRVCLRYAGDHNRDDPVVVDGDGKGRSRVDPFVRPPPRAPRLDHLLRCSTSFAAQIKRVFSS